MVLLNAFVGIYSSSKKEGLNGSSKKEELNGFPLQREV
jgi:hypothetical protein